MARLEISAAATAYQSFMNMKGRTTAHKLKKYIYSNQRSFIFEIPILVP